MTPLIITSLRFAKTGNRWSSTTLSILNQRTASTTDATTSKSYKVVVVGGGTGGCSVSHRFSKHFGQGKVAVIEPADKHYYQPMFTLVGSGIKKLDDTVAEMGDVLPRSVDWLRHSVAEFSPDRNMVTMSNGEQVQYEYLIVAVGLKLDFAKVKGLPEALESCDGVCSNYSPQTVHKTLSNLQRVTSGTAIFTFPSTPIKCPGAPQKIMYLADAYWRKRGVREQIKIMYNTPLPVIFGVPKYAQSLMQVVNARGLTVNFRQELIEVKGDSREAVFAKIGEQDGKPSGDTVTYNFDMLHVSPPCAPPDVITSSPLSDSALGFVNVDRETLQHVNYGNVFALGDCSNLATSKTAAACSYQSYIIEKNLLSHMAGKELTHKYDGYTSCPLTTGDSKCILAEFGYDGRIMETFPIDQGKERRSMYYLKKDVMPPIYWRGLIRGTWNGPAVLRKLLNPFNRG